MTTVKVDFLGGGGLAWKHYGQIDDNGVKNSNEDIIDNSLTFERESSISHARAKYYVYSYNSTVVGGDSNNTIYGSKNVSRKINLVFSRPTRTIEMDFGVNPKRGIHQAARQFDPLDNNQPGKFSEYLYGGGGNDIVSGRDGADYIDGGVGNDVIYGGADNDFLYGGAGNDLIFTGDLSKGETDMVYGGAGADTFFIGETTTSTTEASAFDGVDLALSLAGDVTDLLFTAFLPGAKVAKEIVPMLFDGLKAMRNNDAGVTTIEDVTKATFATIHDFNPREDTFVIPFASEGNYNIEVTELTTGAPGFALKYKNNGKTFAEIYFDETLGLSDSAVEFYTTSLLQTAMIIEEGSVVYGAGDNPIADDLYDLMDAGDQSEVDALSGRYMVLGAYAGAYIEDSDVYPGNNLHGTHLGDQLVAYEVSGDAFIPQEADDTDLLFGYEGDDLFYTGGGTNFVFGGESKFNNNNYTEYDDSDTVSYVDATHAVVVDLSSTLSDENGDYAEVRGAFVSSSGEQSVDKLYSIENIAGSQFADTMTGDDGANTLLGEAGDDTLFGKAGDDTLFGGEGEDTAKFSGNYVEYSFSAATIGGENLLTVSSSADGTDYLDGIENLEFADQTVNVDDLSLVIEGTSGADTLNGGNGDDTFFGKAGNDRIGGNSGNDRIEGDDGNDTIFGHSGNDTIFGGNGDDDLAGGNNDDILEGGAGNDRLNGERGDDILEGGDGQDRLLGGAGGDLLQGGAGDDILYGGDGDDELFGGAGNDELTGNGGFDTFVFEDGNGANTILDFAANEVIDLSGLLGISDFADLSATHLTQVGGNAVINDLAGTTIALNSVDIGNLSNANFLF